MSRLDSIIAIADEYVGANDLSRKYVEHIRQQVRDFDSWHAMRDCVPENESDTARINAWVAWLAARGLSPVTVNAHIGTMKALIRFATPDDEPLPRMDKIRRQKTPEQVKPAYRIEEIRQLCARAPDYQPMGRRIYGRGRQERFVPRHAPDGAKWSIWWEAFVRVAYGSGQYLSDLRVIHWDAVQPDGAVTFVRHKTGKLITFRLNAAAIEAAHKIGHPERILPWDFQMGSYFPREWKLFCTFAGVRCLGPKSIRRSAITYTYIDQGPEAARQLAGHSSFTITSAHYIDWSIVGKPIVEPRAI